MSHRVEWKEKIEARHGELARITYCKYQDTYYEVVREYEKGCEVSNLIEYVNICGYLFTPPGEERSAFYSKGWKTIETWSEYSHKKYMPTPSTYNHDFELSCKNLIEYEPEVKYLIAKYKKASDFYSVNQLFKLYWVWKKYKSRTEALVELGYFKIALNLRVYKLGGTISQELIKNLKKGKFDRDIKLNNLIACVKYDISEQELRTCYAISKLTGAVAKIDAELYRYAKKMGMIDDWHLRDLYEDYYKVLKENGNHDINDPYWRYPKNIQEAHDKIMIEKENIEVAKLAKRKAEIESGLQKAYELLKESNTIIEGYAIYFPENFDEWKEQASKLHQCIVANGYYKKVIEGKTILAFIRKDNEPVATIEFDRNKKIKQFYADERANDIYPSKEVKALTNQWLDSIPLDLIKQQFEKTSQLCHIDTIL